MSANTANSTPFDEPFLVKNESTWHLIDNGRRRRIPSARGLVDYRSQFPEKEIDLGSLKRGPVAPSSPYAVFNPQIQRFETLGRFRENIGLLAAGRGIEVGAGGRPLTTSIGAFVRYVDKYSTDEIMKYSSARHGANIDDIVTVDVVDSISELSQFSNDELDFVIACHVIEHSANPIGAIDACAQRLRSGGKLILIIPDKERTHDKKRSVTTLDHMVSDYYMPSTERDFEHYVERLNIVNRIPLNRKEDFVTAWSRKDDIHMHTFTYASFSTLATFVENEINLKLFWSHDGNISANSQEMYFVFERV